MRGMLHRVLEFHNSKRSSQRVGELLGNKGAENHFTTEPRRTRRTPSDVKLGHYPGSARAGLHHPTAEFSLAGCARPYNSVNALRRAPMFSVNVFGMNRHDQFPSV